MCLEIGLPIELERIFVEDETKHFSKESVLGSVGYSNCYETNRIPCIVFPFPLLEGFLCKS